jgi:hypothetical protein
MECRYVDFERVVRLQGQGEGENERPELSPLNLLSFQGHPNSSEYVSISVLQ